jgi:preprotein translocase subunit SecG
MGFLIGTFIVLFVFAAFFLILLVMVQSGKGGGLGSLGGGASQTAFGSSGADIMTKATRIAAFGFIFIAFILSFLFAKKETILELPKDENATIVPAKDEAKDAKTSSKDAPVVTPPAKNTDTPAKQ